jgi:hypothetical protein
MNIPSKLSSVFLTGIILIFVTFGCAHKKNPHYIGPKSSANPPEATKGNNDFHALNLSGQNILPVSVDIGASGQLFLKANSDSTKLYFTLYVDSLRNIMEAFIKYGTKDYNGPKVARLYPSLNTVTDTLSGQTFTGLLNSGIITSHHFENGALEGESIKDLIRVLETDSAYVQINTKYHRSGAIRAQIMSN